MSAKRSYSENDRATALAALAANGGNVFKTAREIGIGESTLRFWKNNPTLAKDCEAQKQDLADRLEALAHTIVDLLPDKLKVASARDAAVTMGIALEKMRLLREQPTSINRDDHLSDEERSREAAALFDAARERASGQPAPCASVN